MLDLRAILCVYNYLNAYTLVEQERPDDAQLKGYFYYLLYAVDSSGEISQDILRQVYFDKYQQQSVSGKYIGPFNNLEEVNQYLLLAMTRLEVAKTHLISVADYNAVLEETETSSDFFQKLIQTSSVVENTELIRDRKGFLGKIFD